MRSLQEREATALWLQEQHQQFFQSELESDPDYCQDCRRIVEEGTSHDAAAHLALS